MRLVEESKLRPGTIEVSWMWLPTFIGQNTGVLKELDAALTKAFPPPFEATEEKLDEINAYVLGWLVTKFPLSGLRRYLDGLKYVGDYEDAKERMKGIEWTCYERTGWEIKLLTDEFEKKIKGLPREEQNQMVSELPNVSSLPAHDTRVLCMSILGWTVGRFIADDEPYVESGPYYYPLQFSDDDRQCWVTSAQINMRSIKRIGTGE